MELAERHARLRAHDDTNTIAIANLFVVDYFGGDYDRAAWFMQEMALMRGGAVVPTFHSVKNGRIPFHPKGNQ